MIFESNYNSSCIIKLQISFVVGEFLTVSPIINRFLSENHIYSYFEKS
jgi:hypothetical protein